MHKHILLVMKWLGDKESVAEQDLITAKNDAYAALTAASAYAASIYGSDDYDNASTTASTAYAVYAAISGDDAEMWVNRYFKITKESEKDYIKLLAAD